MIIPLATQLTFSILSGSVESDTSKTKKKNWKF